MKEAIEHFVSIELLNFKETIQTERFQVGYYRNIELSHWPTSPLPEIFIFFPRVRLFFDTSLSRM